MDAERAEEDRPTPDPAAASELKQSQSRAIRKSGAAIPAAFVLATNRVVDTKALPAEEVLWRATWINRR